MKDGISELKGTCVACGSEYSGQVLKEPRYQICVKCGSVLVVRSGELIINIPDSCFETLYYKFVEKEETWRIIGN
jgi:hypothetical protein